MQLVIGNKNYSSCSLRPWLAMKHLGLAFEELRIPLYQADSAVAIARYSPAGRVPILLDGDRTIWDSLAILEYLAECYPQLSWWPEDVAARALGRCISAEMHSGFLALREQMPMNCKARFPGQGLTPESGKDIARVRQIWSDCRTQYATQGDFLLGNFSIADAMYAPVVLRFVTYGVEVSEVEQAYMATLLNLPAMQDWIAAGLAETEAIANYDERYTRDSMTQD